MAKRRKGALNIELRLDTHPAGILEAYFSYDGKSLGYTELPFHRNELVFPDMKAYSAAMDDLAEMAVDEKIRTLLMLSQIDRATLFENLSEGPVTRKR